MEAKEAYLLAGKIAKEVIKRGTSYIQEEAYVLEICEKVENDIVKLRGMPAFPCNVSQNEEAAHYTAAPNDKKKIRRRTIVKLDIGVHIDGYIADTAVTIGLGSKWYNMVSASKEILNHSLSKIKPGLPFYRFGSIVESKARSLGFITIENLAGHMLGPYLLHAGESVPNRSVLSRGMFKMGKAYAIEPFIVDKNAKGYVINKGSSNIYRIVGLKKVRDKALKNMMMKLWSQYKGLPFAARWVEKDFGDRGLELLKSLVKKGIVYSYPVLVEAGNSPVAQFEHTILVEGNGIIITTI